MNARKNDLPLKQLERYSFDAARPCHYERLNWLYSTISRRRPRGRTVRILEVGCGIGTISIPLGLIERSEVRGIDTQEEKIRIFKSRNSLENVSVSVTHLFDCPVGTYDFIVLAAELERSCDIAAIVKYLGQHIGSAAEIHITTTDANGPLGIMYRLRNGWSALWPGWSRDTMRLFGRRRLQRELEAAGLEIVSVRKAHVLTPLIRKLFPEARLPRLSRMDYFMAQLLPGFLVNSRFYRIRPKRSHLKVIWKRR